MSLLRQSIDPDRPQTEHHWHEPSQGQVTKAMYQVIADLGVTKETIIGVIEKKVAAALDAHVTRILSDKRFDELLIAAVASYMQTEKMSFERNGYGFHQRIRNLIEERLKEVLVRDYQITVAKKG